MTANGNGHAKTAGAAARMREHEVLRDCVVRPGPALKASQHATNTQKQHVAAGMEAVFPDAHTPLAQADPEVYGILQDEKARQWCVCLCALWRLGLGAHAIILFKRAARGGWPCLLSRPHKHTPRSAATTHTTTPTGRASS